MCWSLLEHIEMHLLFLARYTLCPYNGEVLFNFSHTSNQYPVTGIGIHIECTSLVLV